MDSVFTELEEFRKLYFKALKNREDEAEELKEKIVELEQLIENNLTNFETHNVDKLTKKMKKNVNEATTSINNLNETTSIASNTITFVDDVLFFIKEIL